jgi:hypothetical protein
MLTKSGHIPKKGTAGLVILVVVSLVISLIPVAEVQASVSQTQTVSDEGNPPLPETTGRGINLLEKALRREQMVNENLSTLLEKADKAIIKLEETISKGQATGRDTAALEDALEELKDKVEEGRIDLDRAAGLLERPAGFDNDGRVIDRETALETIKEIHQLQQGIRRLLADSLKDALKAVHQYHQNDPSD